MLEPWGMSFAYDSHPDPKQVAAGGNASGQLVESEHKGLFCERTSRETF